MTPQPDRRIFDAELYAHFVTFSTYQRRRLLDEDRPKQIVLGVLNEELEQVAGRCIGFVIMPDHVHALLWFPETGQLSRLMHGWKRKSSYHIQQWYANSRYHQDLESGRFWQAKYYSFEICERGKLEEKLHYMHENPVRAGLVAKATDWQWSSARWYDAKRPVGIQIRWVD